MDYHLKIEELMENIRKMLVNTSDVKERKLVDKREKLFDEFNYMVSLKNSAETSLEYREAYIYIRDHYEKYNLLFS